MTSTLIDTRTRLLGIAAEQFLARGYVETTLRGIAAEAGVKAGSIYYHFDSKDSMLEAILGEGIERIAASLESGLADAGQNPLDQVVAAIHAHLGALFEHGAFTACHVKVFHQAPSEVKAKATVRRDAYEATWTRLLTEAETSGRLRPMIEPGIARLYLLGALNATIEWFTPGDIAALADAFAEMFVNGAFIPRWKE